MYNVTHSLSHRSTDGKNKKVDCFFPLKETNDLTHNFFGFEQMNKQLMRTFIELSRVFSCIRV